jgi:hypothetical protein
VSGGGRRVSGAAWPLVTLAAVAFALARPVGLAGQVVVNHGALDAARRNVVHLHTGVEYGFVAGVGYSRGIGIGDRTLLLSGGLTMPWADADAHDYDAHVGATIGIVGQRRLRLLGGIGWSVRGTENTLTRMTSLATDAVLIGGYWTPRWFVAGESGYDAAGVTYIRHTDRYRERFYADARDGWYTDTGGNMRFGLAGGVSFGRYDVVLRAGTARDSQGNSQLLPGYATLGLNLRF